MWPEGLTALTCGSAVQGNVIGSWGVVTHYSISVVEGRVVQRHLVTLLCLGISVAVLQASQSREGSRSPPPTYSAGQAVPHNSGVPLHLVALEEAVPGPTSAMQMQASLPGTASVHKSLWLGVHTAQVDCLQSYQCGIIKCFYQQHCCQPPHSMIRWLC